MVYRWLAIVVVGLHFCYLAYVLVGGFIAWRWPRTIYLHVAAVAWAVLIVATRVPCPLTWLDDALLTLGGQRPLARGFIGSYVSGVFFPTGYQDLAQGLLAALVVVSWAGLAIRRAHSSGPEVRRPASRHGSH
jgi:hypothetical protein